MRVIFANHSSAPTNLGGAERSLLRFVEDWQRIDPGLEPVFVTKAPEGTFIKALKERGWPFKAYRFRGWALPSEQPAPAAEQAAFATVDYATVRAMIDLFRKNRPDLVVTNTLVAPWASFAAAALGIPQAWIIREYGDLDHGLHFQVGRHATFRDIGLMSGAVITNSEAMRAHLATDIDSDKISVAYPVVDTDALLAGRDGVPAVTPFPQPNSDLRVTVVGRVEEGKGQHRVIEALGLLRERGLHVTACFVGSWKYPGYDQQLLARARKLGVEDQLVFAGEQHDPAPYIAASEVCVTPSTLEAFGRTTAEYMAMGRAVVASSSGGSAELVAEGVTGRLFDVDDVRTLADALETYARDRALAAEHGAAAPERLSELMAVHTNAAAIARLRAVAETGDGYRLPEIAQYWFGLPAAYASLGATSAKAAVGLLANRLKTRSGAVGRILARPGVVFRRLARR
ncbi:glycosyltransferase involved in cell wall biosynthesis [Curtobacterium pusillum]|uniref:Glycosyltransferase involved in cell wall biosynthesis n=1 Tax=Curtobacterium pusillum TaxID=69373 RepID=A0AAW3T5L8_9MICO|nr:glycosyltransferase involved in cell wall biosynthesis [Curtobacterium pusillum]